VLVAVGGSFERDACTLAVVVASTPKEFSSDTIEEICAVVSDAA